MRLLVFEELQLLLALLVLHFLALGVPFLDSLDLCLQLNHLVLLLGLGDLDLQVVEEVLDLRLLSLGLLLELVDLGAKLLLDLGL